MPKDCQTFADNPQHERQGLKQIHRKSKSKAIQRAEETPSYHYCPQKDIKETLLPRNMVFLVELIKEKKNNKKELLDTKIIVANSIFSKEELKIRLRKSPRE